jgi:hypothetical protein
MFCVIFFVFDIFVRRLEGPAPVPYASKNQSVQDSLGHHLTFLKSEVM